MPILSASCSFTPPPASYDEARELSFVEIAARYFASGILGVMRVHNGNRLFATNSLQSSLISGVPLVETITGSQTIGTCREESFSTMIFADDSCGIIPIFTAST